MCEVLLINPPFFRFVGSHNDRVPITLGYLSAELDKIGVSNKILNADATGSSSYWPIEHIFKNQFDYYKDAVDDKSPLYDEIIEQIVSLAPKTVVILGADPLIPTKDIGSPYIAANFSKRIRRHGIKTVGIGPYFSLKAKIFASSFDLLAIGEPTDNLAKAIKSQMNGILNVGIISGMTIPSYKSLLHKEINKVDMALTSFGCLFPCSFCIAGIQSREIAGKIRHVPTNDLIRDIKENHPQDKIYLGDLNFTYKSKKQLKELQEAFNKAGIIKKFTVEAKVNQLSTEILELYQSLGIKTIKVGIETLNNNTQGDINKKFDTKKLFELRSKCRELDIKFIAYILVGGDIDPMSYKETHRLLNDLSPDNVVTSIWAYDLEADFKYDTHFSPVALARSNSTEDDFFDFLRLAKSINSTVGDLIE